jgi:hypothetical protein
MFKSVRRRRLSPVSRRFKHRDGSFAGVALATINTACKPRRPMA